MLRAHLRTVRAETAARHPEGGAAEKVGQGGGAFKAEGGDPGLSREPPRVDFTGYAPWETARIFQGT